MSLLRLIILGISVLILVPSLGWAASPLTDEDLRQGQWIYREACATCHGGDGRGQVSGLKPEVQPPDFTWCAFNSEEPEQDWQRVVVEGGPAAGLSNFMPAFADALTEEQVRQVVAYLRTFCSEDWPRGELNFPRPLVTGKAWPENEMVFEWSTGRTPGEEQETELSWIVEKRIGPRGQVELKIPVKINDPKDEDALGGIGDVEVGVKYVLYDSLDHLAIVSRGIDVTAPTGSRDRGLGDGTTILGPFLAAGKAWGDLIGQTSLKFEYPFDTDRASKTFKYNLALSYPIMDTGRLTEGQLLLELNGKSEWGAENPIGFQLYVTPSFRKSISRSGLWAVAVGVQIPVTGQREVDYRVLGYISYEYGPLQFLD